MPSLKQTFSTTYKIATLAAHQIMHHDKKQSNKAKIADLIEEVIKRGVTQKEIFESTNQFCRDYEWTQYTREINRQDKLPNLKYHKLFEYIIECISYQAYKEGAVMGLFRNANTGSNPQEVNWQNLPTEVGREIAKHLSVQDSCRAAKVCKNANTMAKEEKDNKIEAIRQQILGPPTTEMEVQIENLNIAGPSRQ